MSAGPDAVAEHLRRLAAVLEVAATHHEATMRGIVEAIAQTLTNGGKVMFAGNGGSAADAQHLATEYMVRFRRAGLPLAALALTTDSSLLTAAANDLGFEQVFARQVTGLGRPGDVLVLHSTSGNSANLLRAADAARAGGIAIIALLGGDGGALRGVADIELLVDTDDPAHAQETHLAIGHAVCDAVEARLRGEA